MLGVIVTATGVLMSVMLVVSVGGCGSDSFVEVVMGRWERWQKL